MAVGPEDRLAVFASDGSKAAELPVSTISQPVKVGNSSCIISYGKDLNGHLSVIVAPDSGAPAERSFVIDGSTVVADATAVPVVTFSKDLKRVTVDPGLVGVVTVNGKRISRPVAAGQSGSEDVRDVAAASPAQAKPSAAPAQPKSNTPVAASPSPAPRPPEMRQPSPPARVASATPSPAPSATPKPAGSPRVASTTPPGGQPTEVFQGRKVEKLAAGEKVYKGYETFEGAQDMRLSIPNFPMLVGGMGKMHAATNANGNGNGNGNGQKPEVAATTWEIPKNPKPMVQSSALAANPNLNVVPITDYYLEEGKIFLTNGSVEANKKADSVNLQYKSYWAESVTPPSGQLPLIGSNEIKLLEVRGPVSVIMPGSSQPKPATEGMTIPSGTVVQTAAGGSAAALLGGVNSARFAPNTEAAVNQNAGGGRRSTLIDLKSGTVFSKVGRKNGESQDFQVKTPTGVAAAKGTDWATALINGVMGVFTSSGDVGVNDNGGAFVGMASSGTQGGIGMLSVPPVSNSELQAMLNTVMQQAQEMNNKLNGILNKQSQGQPLTDAERNFLQRSAGVFFLVEARRTGLGAFEDDPLALLTISPIPDPSITSIGPAGFTSNPLFQRVLLGPGQLGPEFLGGGGGLVPPTRPNPTTPF